MSRSRYSNPPATWSDGAAVEPLLLTTRQTAAMLNVSTRMVWGLKKAGRLRAVRIGRSIRYDRRDILALIDNCKEAFTPAVTVHGPKSHNIVEIV
ncbi:MAG: helix-turn-helix domain-containing protein [Phycisphaerae bacterium]